MTWSKGKLATATRFGEEMMTRSRGVEGAPSAPRWMRYSYNLLSVGGVWRGNCVGLSSLLDRAVGGAGEAGGAGGLVVLVVVLVVVVELVLPCWWCWSWWSC